MTSSEEMKAQIIHKYSSNVSKAGLYSDEPVLDNSLIDDESD